MVVILTSYIHWDDPPSSSWPGKALQGYRRRAGSLSVAQCRGRTRSVSGGWRLGDGSQAGGTAAVTQITKQASMFKQMSKGILNKEFVYL